MEDGLVIQVLGWHNRLDDVLHEVLVDLVIADLWRVLCGDKDGVNPLRDHSTILLLVFHCDLGLSIWSQPTDCSVLPYLYLKSSHQNLGLQLRALEEKGEIGRAHV